MSARPLPWDLITGGVLIAALLVGVIYFPVRIFTDADARAREHRGIVTVAFCTYSGRSSDVADCVGTFVSDDGTLHVPDVTFSFTGPHQNLRRHDPTEATLAGPDDTTADLPEQVFVEQAVMWTLDATLLAWLIAQTVWFVRTLRRHRAAL